VIETTDIQNAIEKARKEVNSPSESALLDICEQLLNIVMSWQCEFCESLATERHLDYRVCKDHLAAAVDNVHGRTMPD